MKKRNEKLYFDDIISSIEKIKKYIKTIEDKEFIKNSLIVDAVIRNIEIIGEASKNISDTIKKKHPDIPWKRMIGLRNITIHEYFGVDLEIIWEIVSKNLPEIKPKLNKIRKNYFSGRRSDG